MANYPMAGTKMSTAKTELLASINKTPAELAAEGKAVVDRVIYTARAIGANNSPEIFESADTKKAGITNLNNRKLEKDENFMLTAIRLESAEIEGTDEINHAAIANADFSAALNARISNGELTIKSGNKVICDKLSADVFRRKTTATEDKGLYYLESPKFIEAQAEIIPTLYLPDLPSDGSQRTVVRLALYGVVTSKNV